MQEALEMVCRKRKLENPKDYALVLVLDSDTKILIPLDRTVASLQGKREVLLVKRLHLLSMGINEFRGQVKTTDPDGEASFLVVNPTHGSTASILKRHSDVPAEIATSTAIDFTAYKKYTVFRKVPMLITKQERTMDIDGVYIHVRPSSLLSADY